MAIAPLGRIAIVATLAVLGLGSAARAAGELVPASRLVPLSDLVGRDPITVRARLADAPAAWPIRPELVLKTPTGVLTFVSLYNLFQRPAFRVAVTGAGQGDSGAGTRDLDCAEYASINGRAPDVANLDVLMFRDGRLEAAFAYTESKPTIPVPRPTAPWSQWEAFYDQPVPTPYIARPGDLPLADGSEAVLKLGLGVDGRVQM